MSTRFGILAYGPSARLHREAALALLSVQAYAPASSEVVLLTDHPDQYRWFGDSITLDRLTPAVVREWRGPHDDRFRPSLEALKRLGADGMADVVLADTDTLVRQDLGSFAERLSAGAVFMHHREYLLSAPPRRGDRALAGQIVGHTWGGITPDATSAMWNAGVVAGSRRHAGLFNRVLDVFDRLRPVTRHFAVDQLACSIVLPAYAPIEAAAPWFDHYWGNRPWFNRCAERFLSRALLEDLTPREAAERLKTQPITGALEVRPPWWLKRVRRLIGPVEPDDHDIPDSRNVRPA